MENIAIAIMLRTSYFLGARLLENNYHRTCALESDLHMDLVVYVGPKPRKNNQLRKS